MLRSIIERTTRRLIFRRTLDVGQQRIPMLVSPCGGLRYIAKPMAMIDPELMRLAREYVRPGDTVWDVGANLGLFTFAAATLAGPTGRVVAFEPDSWLVQVLRRSVSLQAPTSARIDVIPAAVAADVDIRTFCVAARSRSANHLAEYGSTQTGGAAETQSVICVSLNWVMSRMPPPSVLKIDVEGAEAEVLRGASEVLKLRPKILCEVSGENSAEVTSLLHEAGYFLVDGETGKATESAPWSTVALT